MANKYYTIKVGDTFNSPMEVLVGHINKVTEAPNGKEVTATQVIGELAIPNYSVIWAKQGKKGDKLTGVITPLKWGDPEGSNVEIRYLPNCSSLDKRFQEQEKFRIQDEDAEISLFYGLNEFDEVTKPLLCQMLRLHTYNSSNESRDPEKTDIRFCNYEPDRIMNVEASDVRMRQTAENLVLDSRDSRKKLEALAQIFDLDKKSLDELLFSSLMRLTAKPRAFLSIIETEKKKLENTLQKSNELGLVNFDMPHVVMISIGNKKDILISAETPVNGANEKERMAFMLDNMFEPEIFEALYRLGTELTKYEKANLQ